MNDQELQKLLIMLYIDFYSKNVMNKQVYDKIYRELKKQCENILKV